MLLAVCALGYPVRERGACLGPALPVRLRFDLSGGGNYARSSPGSHELSLTLKRPRSKRERYALLARSVSHARGRHDAGCFGLGVPLAGLEQLAADWGRTGDGAYVLDGVRAAAELLPGPGAWNAELASETLEHELRARITPEVPSRETVRRLAGRWATW